MRNIKDMRENSILIRGTSYVVEYYMGLLNCIINKYMPNIGNVMCYTMTYSIWY